MIREQRLTQDQEFRLRHILAYGPVGRRSPVDDQLEALGWIEPYDGDHGAVEGVAGAVDELFEPSGAVRDKWCETARCAKCGLLVAAADALIDRDSDGKDWLYCSDRCLENH